MIKKLNPFIPHSYNIDGFTCSSPVKNGWSFVRSWAARACEPR